MSTAEELGKAVRKAAKALTLAKEIATVCFTNGIVLDGCGCCSALIYKGVEFDHFTLDSKGNVSGSALLMEEGEERQERVRFSFQMGNATEVQIPTGA